MFSIDSKVPLAGRLRHFLGNWKKLTQDKNILKIVQRYKIPILSQPTQRRTPGQVVPGDQLHFVDQEILSMLEKGAIQQVFPVCKQFLSSLFLVGKKDGGYRPVINL